MLLDITRESLRSLYHWIAWGFGSGLSPVMPGTCGTLVGVGLYVWLPALPLVPYLLLILIMFVAGIWLCGQTAVDLGIHDHSSIVWDEIVGFFVTMISAPAGWGWVVAGFVLFRIFDIWKPWPINWLDRHVHGGLGIMLDDLLAGVYAAVLLQITSLLLSTWLRFPDK